MKKIVVAVLLIISINNIFAVSYADHNDSGIITNNELMSLCKPNLSYACAWFFMGWMGGSSLGQHYMFTVLNHKTSRITIQNVYFAFINAHPERGDLDASIDVFLALKNKGIIAFTPEYVAYIESYLAKK